MAYRNITHSQPFGVLTVLLITLLLLSVVGTASAEAPPIALVDSATPAEEVGSTPGNVYMGQKITFADEHTGNVVARVGVWEADKSKTWLENYPFTEYVLMISGHVVVVNEDGTSNAFKAGDTFVIPKGFSGVWHILEPMKKQMVQVGDPSAKVVARALVE